MPISLSHSLSLSLSLSLSHTHTHTHTHTHSLTLSHPLTQSLSLSLSRFLSLSFSISLFLSFTHTHTHTHMSVYSCTSLPQVAEDGTSITLHWPDGHVSSYDSIWLNDHQLQEGDAHLSNRLFKLPPRITWTTDELRQMLPKITFSKNDIFNDPAVMYEWLMAVWKYGMARVTDVGTEEGTCLKMGRELGNLFSTVYG